MTKIRYSVETISILASCRRINSIWLFQDLIDFWTPSVGSNLLQVHEHRKSVAWKYDLGWRRNLEQVSFTTVFVCWISIFVVRLFCNTGHCRSLVARSCSGSSLCTLQRTCTIFLRFVALNSLLALMQWSDGSWCSVFTSHVWGFCTEISHFYHIARVDYNTYSFCILAVKIKMSNSQSIPWLI
jgi:hypothetical protein